MMVSSCTRKGVKENAALLIIREEPRGGLCVVVHLTERCNFTLVQGKIKEITH